MKGGRGVKEGDYQGFGSGELKNTKLKPRENPKKTETF